MVRGMLLYLYEADGFGMPICIYCRGYPPGNTK